MSSKETILGKASEWMLARGWKQKVAKRRQFDQSLFEHTLVELDATLQPLPILKQRHHFELSLEDEQVLIVSLIAHDVGKERVEWQTLSLLISPPSLNFVAAALLAELHGRCGYFPAHLRLRPVGTSITPRYEVAEVLDLQGVRDKARKLHG